MGETTGGLRVAKSRPQRTGQRAAELTELFASGKEKPIGIKIDEKGLDGASILLPKNKLGIVQKVEIEVGPKIREADLIAHYEKAAYAQKYVGLGGKARALKTQLKNWIARNGEPAPLSMAWEAQHDIQKLESIRAARLEALQSGKLDPKKAEALQHELYELNHQLAEQQATLARMDRSPGFGKIDARIKTNIRDFKAQNPDVFKNTDELASLLGVSKAKLKEMGKDAPALLEEKFFDKYYPSRIEGGQGFQLKHMPQTQGKNLELSKAGKIVESAEKVKQVEKFKEGATVATVYERLLGKSSTSSMKAYADMLIREKIGGIKSYKDLEKHIKALEKDGFSGRSVDDVRHALKEQFNQQVVNKMTTTSPTALRKKYSDLPWQENPAKALEQAQHRELMSFTEGLNGADKGKFGEKWYKKIFGSNAVEQQKISKADAAKQGLSFERDRVPDLIEGNQIKEIKGTSDKITERDTSQFRDLLQVAEKEGGSSIKLADGSERTVDKLRYVFTDPKGVKANIEWMKKRMTDSGETVSFEVFNIKGERKVIDYNSLASGELSNKQFTQWLGL
jgi:hypothetical protein